MASVSIKDIAVQAAVLDGFEQVGSFDIFGIGQVRDGAGNLEDAVVGSGREVQLLHGLLQQIARSGADPAILFQVGLAHAAVAVNPAAVEAFLLNAPGFGDAVAHGFRGLRRSIFAQFADGKGGSFHMDINAVQ